MVEGIRVLLEIVAEVQIFQAPRQERVGFLELVGASDRLVMQRVTPQHMTAVFYMVFDEVVVIIDRFSLLQIK